MKMKEMTIGVILTTTRENRASEKIGAWILEEAPKVSDVQYELIDLRDYPMGFIGDSSSNEVAGEFNAKLNEMDGYIFVLAEYNHSIPGVLKNALDWAKNDSTANKPAGIVSYGAVGGARAAEHLRTILGQLGVADISRQVLFNIFTDFENFSKFKPMELQMKPFKELVEDVTLWATTFKQLRNSL